MRFEVRWSNGYWKLFHKHEYCSVAAFGLEKDALAALDRCK